jgi:S1-C subfamily serine protease
MRMLAAYLVLIVASGLAQVAAAQTVDASLHDRARLSTVYLRATGRTITGVPLENVATGFFVNDRGNILTVNHLLAGLGDVDPESIKIEGRVGSKNSNALTASIYDAKPNRDLLLLDVDDTDAGAALCVNPDFRPQRLARTLFTVGFPKVLPIVFGEGKIISSGGPNGSWITNIAFEGGQSGSPIYDEHGTVIGLAKGQLSDNDQPVPGLYVVLPIGDAEGLVPSWKREADCAERVAFPPTSEPSADEVNFCVLAVLADTAESWVVTGGARAEGSGSSFSPKSDERNVCYSAPPNFRIQGQVEKIDRGNNAGRGSISQLEYITDGDTTRKACVTVKAWGADGPFGAGGWQNVELTGKIVEVLSPSRRSELETVCRRKITSAISNVSSQQQ